MLFHNTKLKTIAQTYNSIVQSNANVSQVMAVDLPSTLFSGLFTEVNATNAKNSKN